MTDLVVVSVLMTQSFLQTLMGYYLENSTVVNKRTQDQQDINHRFALDWQKNHSLCTWQVCGMGLQFGAAKSTLYFKLVLDTKRWIILIRKIQRSKILCMLRINWPRVTTIWSPLSFKVTTEGQKESQANFFTYALQALFFRYGIITKRQGGMVAQ